MGSKRGNGEGTYRKRPGGGWEYRFKLGYDSDGVVQRKSFYGRTKTDCKVKSDEYIDNSKNGLAISKNMSLSAWSEEWLNLQERHSSSKHIPGLRVHLKTHTRSSDG